MSSDGLAMGVRVCGRTFSDADLDLIRAIAAGTPTPNRRQIATAVCKALGWVSPGGRLKEMSGRVALLRLARRGLIDLPPPLGRTGNRNAFVARETIAVPERALDVGLEALGLVAVRPVVSRADSTLWNEVVARFHYLGYRRLPGAQARYLVDSDRGLVGALGFGASAWKVDVRDRWIGWTASVREGRLHLIVNNARFLLLPWIRVQNLASRVLGLAARRIVGDWAERYGYEPVLLETFVERGRFTGACYRAANWCYLGDTRGRGKLDRDRRAAVAVKHVLALPLRADFREVLCT